MLRPPFLLLKNHFLSENLCKQFIDFFNDNPQYHFSGQSGDGVYPESLQDTEISLRFTYADKFSCVQKLIPYINDITERYKNIHPHLNDLAPWKVFDYFQLQKYEPGEFYNGVHCEHGPSAIDQSDRVIAWMVYLNDVYDGGGTHFPQYEYTTEARQGTIALWPAGWTHMHNGVVSPTESKYILTGWYNYEVR